MDFFVDSGGNVVRVAPENIYLGSTNANVVRLIGAFPYSSSVSVSFALPTGNNTVPYPMTPVFELNGIKDNLGAAFSVWELPLGVKYDALGNAIPDDTITEHCGTVGVQFKIVKNDGQGRFSVLGTAESSFVVNKGVPSDYTYDPADIDDIRSTFYKISVQLSEIYGKAFEVTEDLAEINERIDRIDGEIDNINESNDLLSAKIDKNKTDIATHTEELSTVSRRLESTAIRVNELWDSVGDINTVLERILGV